MTRQKSLLVALLVVLVVVLAYLFIYKPAADEMAETRETIEDTQAQQSQVRAEIAQLEEVRSQSPQVESMLAAAETVIPRNDTSLPAAVRQLQVAANQSGSELVSVAMARPVQPESSDDAATLPEDLAAIGVTVTVNGGYFQLVDFLRRVEDPVISPRAILWTTASVTLEEYPTLTASFDGSMFAYVEDVDAEPAEPEPTETATDVDVDVDVDATVEEEAS